MVEGTLQGITNYIITLDKLGQLKTSNHSLAPLFGVSDDEMMTSSYRAWMGGLGGDTNDTLKKDINRVFEIGEQITKKNEVINVASRGGTLAVGYNIMPLWADKGEKKRYSRRKSSLLNSVSGIGGLESSSSKEEMSGLGALMSDRPASDCTSSLAGDSELGTSPKQSPKPMGRRLSENTALSERYNKRSEHDDRVLQGVVIVLENVTEERLMQSAIQRYQRRLNEMEDQVRRAEDRSVGMYRRHFGCNVHSAH